ncbi:MAG: hypothetical protein SFT94_12295 [Pseudanabaenaceae cyanobacterium bins.68]|nr:hypothetical protein [Pseudanabaenaceae cyanobacterium bins.68]
MTANPFSDSNLAEIALNLPASLVQNIGQEVGEELPQSPSWEKLQVAISRTSGFKQWLERLEPSQTANPETVAQYLRETLENLAY